MFGDYISLEKIFISGKLEDTQPPYISYDQQDGVFQIHLGHFCYNYGAVLTESGSAELIHQLVHIWQLLFRPESDDRNSTGFSCHAASEMNFHPGLHWDNYSEEQQALIVEEWFNNGMHKNDPLFVYAKKFRRPLP